MPDGYDYRYSCLLPRQWRQRLAMGFPAKCETKNRGGTDRIKSLHLLSQFGGKRRAFTRGSAHLLRHHREGGGRGEDHTQQI